MSTNEPPKREEAPSENHSKTSEGSDNEEGPQTPTKEVTTIGYNEILETELTSMMKDSAIKKASIWIAHDENTLWLESATNPVTPVKFYLLYKEQDHLMSFDEICVSAKFENLWEICEKVKDGEFKTYEWESGTFMDKKDPDFNHVWAKCEVKLKYSTKSGWEFAKRKFPVTCVIEYKLSEWEVENAEKGLLRRVTKDPPAK